MAPANPFLPGGQTLMRTVFDHLEREHELVRRALRVLERQAAFVEMGGSFPEDGFDRVMSFFRGFFRAVHDVKEATHLYPAVALHGNDAEVELAGGLLREHGDTCELLNSLALFSEPSGELVAEERQGFVDVARTCVARLSRLMREEETSLFPVARNCLPPDDQLTLLEVFREVDQAHRPADSWDEELKELEATWVE